GHQRLCPVLVASRMSPDHDRPPRGGLQAFTHAVNPVGWLCHLRRAETALAEQQDVMAGGAPGFERDAEAVPAGVNICQHRALLRPPTEPVVMVPAERKQFVVLAVRSDPAIFGDQYRTAVGLPAAG